MVAVPMAPFQNWTTPLYPPRANVPRPPPPALGTTYTTRPIFHSLLNLYMDKRITNPPINGRYQILTVGQSAEEFRANQIKGAKVMGEILKERGLPVPPPFPGFPDYREK